MESKLQWKKLLMQGFGDIPQQAKIDWKSPMRKRGLSQVFVSAYALTVLAHILVSTITALSYIYIYHKMEQNDIIRLTWNDSVNGKSIFLEHKNII